MSPTSPIPASEDASTAGNRRAGMLRVAMAQIAPALADRERNMALHLAQIEAARRQQADAIIFPELSLTGYFVRDMVPDVAIGRDAPELTRLDRKSTRLNSSHRT